jgi:hypothetical protein
VTDEHADWPAVALSAGAELIIGWRPRPARLDAAAVELSAEVAAEIQARCVNTLDKLAGLARRPYGGSPHIEPGEEYLSIIPAELPRGPLPEQEDGDESAGLSDLQRLITVSGLPAISPGELRRGHYLFYAAICRDRGSGQRIGFVRQTDPHRIAKAGGFMALLGQEGLQHLQDPVFVFDEGFDLVVAPQEIAVLRLEAFNRTFADLNTIVSAAPANARLVADVIGKITPAAVDALAAAAAGRPSLARRLQRLARPGAVPAITPDDIAAAMAKHSLDPADIISNSQIAFTEDKAAVFLDLVEQLYYETDFTGEHRRSDRYSPLTR